MKYDDIIIGGGLGGLVATAFLSKAKRKVLLIEKMLTAEDVLLNISARDLNLIRLRIG